MQLRAALYILLPVFLCLSAAKPSRDAKHWVDTWSSMPQLTEPDNLPPPPFNSTAIFQNATIRQTLHMSLGGNEIRVSFSNVFGLADLSITSATIASPTNGAAGVSSVDPATIKTLTFSGNPSFIVPNGALVVSDPIKFDIQPQSMLTVSTYLEQGQQGRAITSHPGSRTNSWISFGNYVSAANLTDSSTINVAHWYFVSSVEIWTSSAASSLIIVGDSITDGRGSITDGNNRWPDLLLAKMRGTSFTSSIAVNNLAAGGNRILHDGLGPNALGRIDRDVLSHAGVKYVLIFEGVNDIGTASTNPADQLTVGNRLIAAYKQIVTRVHKFGIPVFAATITPFCAPAGSTVQPYSDPVREETRQRVNSWIRSSGTFNYVVDFDKILADPAIPSQLNPLYNGGDYLHPNVAGYQAIADAFPLEIFQRFSEGVSPYK